jgi:DNA invertase Pin-like site-specific DNA recombinase
MSHAKVRTPHSAEPPVAAPPLPPPLPGAAPAPFRSAKILDAHLDRLAVVYIRQSSPHQVLHNRESRERQYALVERALALGWSRPRVLVIDEDQGQSGRTADQRGGFHRLLAEVAVAHVGLVLGLEMSRLARSSKDWHQLLEVCALVGTVLADEDGVYDPNDSNDRLLLGLKGTISEFELVTMRNRLERGKLNKALRGELFYSVPTGYIKATAELVEFDPDEQVRHVVRLVFDKFDKLGTAWGVFRYLVRQHIRLGTRPHSGPHRGQVQWRRPTFPQLFNMLKHPIYAGAYTYGRRKGNRPGGAANEAAAADEQALARRWKVFQRDRLPAYISWERYLANQERLRQNRPRMDTQGAPRQGEALLGGLLRCGGCGCRLQPSYGRSSRPRYQCERHLQKGIPATCHGLVASQVDALVAQQVMRALEPASLELSVRALAEVEKERAALARHWQQRLERARYDGREAERRYRAVDPENRLVARTLERRWEEALAAERSLADEYDHFRQEQPLRLSEEERRRIAALAADIPRLWHAPQTTAADRKAIVRHVVDEVVVQVKQGSEYTDVTIRWQGGFTSQHEVRRTVLGYRDLRDCDQLLARVAELWTAGKTPKEIAAVLNAEGFHRPQRQGPFTRRVVRELLYRQGYGPDRRFAAQLGKHEWWPRDLAERVRVPLWKIEYWADKGWVCCRKTPLRRWRILWADPAEIRRLEKLRARSRHGLNRHPAELTTPKGRKEE